MEIDNSVSIHTRNLQSLAIELYKIVNGFSPDIMKDIFPFNTNSSYNIRNRRTFRSRPIRTVLDRKRYHILHLKSGSLFQKTLKN